MLYFFSFVSLWKHKLIIIDLINLFIRILVVLLGKINLIANYSSQFCKYKKRGKKYCFLFSVHFAFSFFWLQMKFLFFPLELFESFFFLKNQLIFSLFKTKKTRDIIVTLIRSRFRKIFNRKKTRWFLLILLLISF